MPPLNPEFEKRIADRVIARQAANDCADFVDAVLQEQGFTDDQRATFWETMRERAPQLEKAAQPIASMPQRELMDDIESREFGNQAMPFGANKGQRIDEIPIGYLLQITEDNEFMHGLRRYVRSRRVQQEMEASEIQNSRPDYIRRED